jgi:hypothetical protein
MSLWLVMTLPSRTWNILILSQTRYPLPHRAYMSIHRADGAVVITSVIIDV